MVKRETDFPFTIDRNLCKNCGICVITCPEKIFTLGQGNEPRICNPEKCKKCNLCFYKCPDFAIKPEVR